MGKNIVTVFTFALLAIPAASFAKGPRLGTCIVGIQNTEFLREIIFGRYRGNSFSTYGEPGAVSLAACQQGAAPYAFWQPGRALGRAAMFQIDEQGNVTRVW